MTPPTLKPKRAATPGGGSMLNIGTVLILLANSDPFSRPVATPTCEVEEHVGLESTSTLCPSSASEQLSTVLGWPTKPGGSSVTTLFKGSTASGSELIGSASAWAVIRT